MGALVPLVIQELPGILSLIKDTFTTTHPGVPAPTDEELMQAFEQAFQSSRARDDQWLSSHPES